MKVLITGATGLVGSELVSQCHESGYTVNYLTTSKNKVASDPNYRGYFWNPATGEIDQQCLNGVSVIINLAGASISERWNEDYKKLVVNSRINSLELLKRTLQNTKNHSVTSLISASAIGVYPNSVSNYYTEEHTEVDDSFLGKVVEQWEAKVDEFSGMGILVSKVRIGLVMSSKGGALPEMAKPIRYYVGAAFGSGEQWQSWIHIADLAGIFLHIAKFGLEGVFNGVAPNPVTNAKLVNEIAKTLDKPLFLPNIPKFVMQAILGEMSYILFASQRVSSKKIEEEGYIFKYSNICQALAAIYEAESECAEPNTKMTKEIVS
ncbi:MAG: TIGR01777 family oxidoreductase [Maribacter sp.]